MSNDAIKQYVVTFHYQEKGLSDLLELASTLTGGGFTPSLKDANGHPHELGSNRFGFISALPAEQVYQLARGLGDKALESLPDVDVEIWPLSHD